MARRLRLGLDREEGLMESQLESSPAVSRRRFVQSAAIAAAGVTGTLAGPSRSLAHGDHGEQRPDVVPPNPNPGGIQIPDGPQIHVWMPGDPSVPLPFSGATPMGFDVDPSTIIDFRASPPWRSMPARR